MTQEQVESQLSAMFDGELPVAECELLSRRIDRDENLRARWSRYALIGAAMRSEPVATARRGFAARVSAALDEGQRTEQRRLRTLARRRALWNTALAASMVTAVAGVSIGMLRYSAPSATGGALARAVAPIPSPIVATPAVAAVPALMPVAAPMPNNGEPRHYVTPINQPAASAGLRTELADLIVAHSEYSTPLMRRSLLSALVSSEDASEVPPVAVPVPAGQANPGQGSPGQSDGASASGTTGR